MHVEDRQNLSKQKGRPRRPRGPLLPVGLGVLLAGAVLLAAILLGRSAGQSVPVQGEPVSSTQAVSTPSPAPPQATPLPTPEPTPSPTPRPAQLPDPLLVLVNSETPIPADWKVTPRMIGEEQVDVRMYDDFMAMADAAAQDDIWLWVASGYRSVEDQEEILERGIVRRMNEYGMSREEATQDALRTINPPGYSEHHTGLCVDLNDVSDDFESTDTYAWLCEHAAEYGFVQRYRQSKYEYTGIDNESWHYRYVGPAHAQRMEELDLCLEEYVEYQWEQGE